MKALESLAALVNTTLLASALVFAGWYWVTSYRQSHCVEIAGHWLAVTGPALPPVCESVR